MARRAHPEDRLQRAVVQLLRFAAIPGAYWFAVPNGGMRSHIEAAIMVGLGVRKGAPDVVVVGSGGRAHFLELKAARGRLSPEQRDVQAWCEAHQVPHAVVRTLDEAEAFLRSHDLLRNMRIEA
jgi:hypothetical protein